MDLEPNVRTRLRKPSVTGVIEAAREVLHDARQQFDVGLGGISSIAARPFARRDP
jgi:hypothetical protein